MKIFSHILGLTLLLGFSTFTWASTPTERNIPISNLYTPQGHSELEQSEVVVTGFLPNNCHKNPNVGITIEDKKISLRVTSLYYGENNPFCAEVITPFEEVVHLGKLDAGFYDVVVNEGDSMQLSGELVIEDAFGEEVYANVESVELEQGDSHQVNGVKLIGHNPSDCYVLKEIEVIENGDKTITIAPKMKKVSELCTMKMTPFTYNVELPSLSPREENLIHVKTMYREPLNIFL